MPPARPPPAGEALARGAQQLEEASPADAHALYREALDMYDVDGKQGQVGAPGGPKGRAVGRGAQAVRARVLARRRCGRRRWHARRGAQACRARRRQASDVYRRAVACLVRNGKYGDAAALLMRFGEACATVRPVRGRA